MNVRMVAVTTSVMVSLVFSLFPPSSATEVVGAVTRLDTTGLSIVSQTDLLEYVPATRVRIEQPGNTWDIRSGANGMTAYIDVAESTDTDISLAETTSRYGISLGQHFTIQSASTDLSFDQVSLQHWAYQPIAMPVFVNHEDPTYAQPYHSRWVLYDDTGNATFSFQANVGILLNPDDIEKFTEFYQITLPQTYELGLFVRADSYNLGPNGAGLALRTEGHQFSALPDVTTFFLPEAGSPNPSTTLTGVALETAEALTHIHLAGTLGNGDHLIMLSHGNGGSYGPYVLFPDPLIAVLDAPEFHGPQQSAVAGAAAEYTSPPSRATSQGPAPSAPAGLSCEPRHLVAFDQDCVPLPPDPPTNWDCTIEYHVSDPDCNPGWQGTPSHNSTTEKVGKTECGDVGGSTSIKKIEVKSGSVSVKLRYATVTGKYESIEEKTTAHAFQEGNGCGQCVAPYVHHYIKAMRYYYEYELFEIWCIGFIETSYCTGSSGISQTTCDRTDCD